MFMDHIGLFQMRCPQVSSRPVFTVQSCSLFHHIDLGLSWKPDFPTCASFSSVSTAHTDTLTPGTGGCSPPSKSATVAGSPSIQPLLPEFPSLPTLLSLIPWIKSALLFAPCGFCLPDQHNSDTIVFRNLMQVKEWMIIRRGNNSPRFSTVQSIHPHLWFPQLSEEAVIIWLLSGISEMM